MVRACLDIPGDVEGGRIVEVEDFLRAADAATRKAALAALRQGRPYRSLNGAWSLTPLGR